MQRLHQMMRVWWGVFKELSQLATCIGEGIQERYAVELGEDLDYTTPATYLEDMETLYEFLFIRHYTNLVDYFKHELYRNKYYYIELNGRRTLKRSFRSSIQK